MSERNFETLEAGATYQTTGGRLVKIIAHTGSVWWAGIMDDDPSDVHAWNENGGFYFANTGSDKRDLIRKIEPKRVVWCNVYPGDELSWFTDKVSADAQATTRRIARIRVEYTPGQFDS